MNERDALKQIAVLAEYGTTGPRTRPPCKSGAMNADKATSLRAAIGAIAREAISAAKAAPESAAQRIASHLRVASAALEANYKADRDDLATRVLWTICHTYAAAIAPSASVEFDETHPYRQFCRKVDELQRGAAS